MSNEPRPKVVSGAKPEIGHYEEFMAHTAHFMLRAYRECGELAEFDLYGQKNILMVGPDAHEAVYRAGEDQVSASAAYQYMVPIFGEGIQYGAPLEIERQQVRFMSDALRPKRMKTYAQVVAQEVEAYIQDWGDEGVKDFHNTPSRNSFSTRRPIASWAASSGVAFRMISATSSCSSSTPSLPKR